MTLLRKIKETNLAERLIILYTLTIVGYAIAYCIINRDVSALLWHLAIFCPAIPLVLAIWNKKWAAILTFLYVFIYVALSVSGQYHDYIGGGGGGSPVFYPYGMLNTTPDHKNGRIKTEPNLLGWAFWPLLLIDQTLVHKSLE